MDRRVWLLVQQDRYRTGRPGGRREVGVFTSPEEAFRAVRCHPDFRGAELAWHPEEWEDGTVFVARSRTRLREGEWEHWELTLLSVPLDEPVFDFREDQEEYRRLRAAHRE